MSVLDAVEVHPKDFRPRTHRQFVVLNVAVRFDDLAHLPRYLNTCYHTKHTLLEAAKVAEQASFRDGTPPVEPFFRFLADRDRKEAT